MQNENWQAIRALVADHQYDQALASCRDKASRDYVKTHRNENSLKVIDSAAWSLLFCDGGSIPFTLAFCEGEIKRETLEALGAEKLPRGLGKVVKEYARRVWIARQEYSDFVDGIEERAHQQLATKRLAGRAAEAARFVAKNFVQLYKVGSSSWAGGHDVYIHVATSSHKKEVYHLDDYGGFSFVRDWHLASLRFSRGVDWGAKKEWSSNGKWCGNRTRHDISIILDEWEALPHGMRVYEHKKKDVLCLGMTGQEVFYLHQGRGFDASVKRFKIKRNEEAIDKERDALDEAQFSW